MPPPLPSTLEPAFLSDEYPSLGAVARTHSLNSRPFLAWVRFAPACDSRTDGRQEASRRLDVIVAREAQQTLLPSAPHFF